MASVQVDVPEAIAVRKVVAQVVAEVAEDELFLVKALEAFDDEEVVRRLKAEGRRRGPLGFGVDATSPVVTYIVYIALAESVRKIVDMSLDRLSKSKRVRRLLRRRKIMPALVPPLTVEQLATVKATIVAASVKAGLSEGRADAIAQATVSKLVLASTEFEQEGNSKAGS
jgi:hypothetical protein